LERVAKSADTGIARRSVNVALAVIQQTGPQRSATEVIVLAFSYPDTHEQITALGVSWEAIWSEKIGRDVGKAALEKAQGELGYHTSEQGYDTELAYSIDIMHRMAVGYLLEESDKDLEQEAAELLEEAEKIYPSVAGYYVEPSQMPNVQDILNEIKAKRRWDDEIPF
jgi:hypothetical protein